VREGRQRVLPGRADDDHIQVAARLDEQVDEKLRPVTALGLGE